MSRDLPPLDYYLFRIESQQLPRDWLIIPRMIQELAKGVRLPGAIKFMEDNYDPSRGEFSTPAVNLQRSFEIVSLAGQTRTLCIAILAEFVDYLLQSRPIMLDGDSSYTTKESKLRTWLSQGIAELKSQAKVISCELATNIQIDSLILEQIKARMNVSGQIYPPQGDKAQDK